MKTAMNAARPATTECPKCYGSGVVSHRHVENGRCFLCDGSGKVDESTASRWLVQQLRQGRGPVAASVSTQSRPSKRIEIDEFGRTLITRCDDGGFSAVLEGWAHDHGAYVVFFDIVAGRIVIDEDSVPNGIAYNDDRFILRRLEGALQRVLKVA